MVRHEMKVEAERVGQYVADRLAEIIEDDSDPGPLGAALVTHGAGVLKACQGIGQTAQLLEALAADMRARDGVAGRA